MFLIYFNISDIFNYLNLTKLYFIYVNEILLNDTFI